jgi:hypothetical protein
MENPSLESLTFSVSRGARCRYKAQRVSDAVAGLAEKPTLISGDRLEIGKIKD